jgi:hypothetical protein
MQQAVPIIYTPDPTRPVVSSTGRIGSLVISMAALAVLITATLLPPARAGVGTHQRMGFPACAWMATTGLPCPTCGMTTSFSHFVRGNWVASVYVQPMGFVLALLTGIAFWGGLYIALTARPIQRQLQRLPMVWLIGAFMAIGIAAWGWKIFIHLRGIDGWG